MVCLVRARLPASAVGAKTVGKTGTVQEVSGCLEPFVAVLANSRYVVMYSSVRITCGQSVGCQWSVQGKGERDWRECWTRIFRRQ